MSTNRGLFRLSLSEEVNYIIYNICTLFLAACGRQTVKIMTPPDASNRVLFGAEQLQTTLDKAGYQVMMQQGDTTIISVCCTILSIILCY